MAVCVLACVGVGGRAEVAIASSPKLARVLPRGIQRGATHTLTFVGDRLNDAEEVFFYDDGFRVLDLKVIDAKKVRVQVQVDSDCRLGEHMVQLRTRSGISEYRIMHVEAYPSVIESEVGNNVRKNAQLIEPARYSDEFPEGVGVVVSGRMLDEDHDWFAVEGTEGDRLSIEVVGTRLGEFCDTVLALYGPEGDSLVTVDDTLLATQDPFLSIKLPADGRYLIHLTDSAGRGANSAWYRMHVGNFPRPTIASPAVAKIGELSEIKFLGDCLGPIKQSLRIKETDLYQDAVQVSDQRGTTPTPVPLRLVDGAIEVFSEQEPNDRVKEVKATHEIPFSVGGAMQSSGDRDTFNFNARKGQRVRVEAYGHRIGSAIDTTIRLRPSTGRPLATGGDSIGTDSLLTTTIPEDGRYTVEVFNANKRFGDDVRYQLDVTLEQPMFTLSVKEFQRYSQQRQQVAVPAGNRFALMITASRNGFDGPFQLSDSQLPASIRMFARPMPAGSSTMPVVFEADAFHDQTGDDSVDNPKRKLPLGRLIDFTGESISEGEQNSSESVVGRFRQQAQLMRVQPNNMSLKDGVVEKLAVAVLEPVPFKVDLESPQVPISQSGRMKLRVNIHRDEGFNAPITLRLPYLPPGISANPTVRANRNQKFIDYPINANGKAAVGTWPICLTAVAPNDQGSMISTELHDLEVVTPFVAIESDMVSAQAGSEVVAKCTLEVLREFDGTAEVRLNALPDHVSSEPQAFDDEAQTVDFAVVVGADCVTGKNHSVNVEVTVMRDGHPIVFNAGRVLMRFSSPAKSDKPVVHIAPKEKQQ